MYKNTNTIDLDALRTELAAFPQIQGELRKALEEGNAATLPATQTAVWGMSYVEAFKKNDLNSYLGSFGARLVGSEIDTEGRLGLNATKWMLSAATGKMLFHTVGRGDEQKQIMLLPGQKVWMHIQMRGQEVLKARKATAEDFQKAKDFAVTNPKAAEQLWSRVGVLNADWIRRFEAEESFTSALPAIPGTEVKNKSRKGRNGRKAKK
jgi:hypothetical protein